MRTSSREISICMRQIKGEYKKQCSEEQPKPSCPEIRKLKPYFEIYCKIPDLRRDLEDEFRSIMRA